MTLPLSTGKIRRALTRHELVQAIHILPDTTSTNTEAFSLAGSGAPHGTVVLAEQQTAGRGRMNREWFSPPFQNIYGSILLRSISCPERISWIPLMTGVAILRAVEAELGLALSLKWPNDLLANNRKVGGILCESTVQGKTDWTIVVGFGVNVNTSLSEFPPALQPIATSLRIETGEDMDRNPLIAAILSELEVGYRQLQSSDFDQLKEAYISHCATLGHRVHIRLTTDSILEGVAADIGPDGALRLISEPDADSPSNPVSIDVKSGEILSVR